MKDKNFPAALIALVALAALILALGFAAQGLGNWTDSHPQYRLVAWIAWNLVLVLVLAATVWRWRAYRRTHERDSHPT